MASLLLSNDLKFIFIHIHKNGGTSIGDFLKNKKYVHINQSTLSAMKAFRKYPKEFDNYFTFSVFRNPWDRFISFYAFLRQWPKTEIRIKNKTWKFEGGDPRNVNFKKWMLKTKFYHNQFPKDENIPVQEISQFDWVTDENNKIMVDKIFNLSEIDKDWKYICNKINISFFPLPVSNPTKHKHYREYYNEASRKHVARVAEREIDYFKYTF
jgi:hypothetical protein